MKRRTAECENVGSYQQPTFRGPVRNDAIVPILAFNNAMSVRQKGCQATLIASRRDSCSTFGLRRCCEPASREQDRTKPQPYALLDQRVLRSRTVCVAARRDRIAQTLTLTRTHIVRLGQPAERSRRWVSCIRRVAVRQCSRVSTISGGLSGGSFINSSRIKIIYISTIS